MPAIAVLVATGFAIRSKIGGQHLDSDAREIAIAAGANNPDTLYDYAFDQEIMAENLTREKWRTIWTSLIQPRLAPFDKRGSVQVALYADGTEGVATLPVSDSAGHKWEIDVNLWGTDNRGRMLLNGYLMSSWVFEYAISKGDNSFAGIWAAKLKGLRHDRPFLEKLGIHSWVMLDPKHGGVKTESFDQIEARLIQTNEVATSGAFK
jgi:hypothetical protein